MRKHVLSAVMAATALTGFSGATLAWNTLTTPELTVFMSGATAMDNSIKNMFESLCNAGTLDFYRNGSDVDTSKVGSAHSAYFCTLSPSNVPGLSASKRVLFLKRSAGGSAQGVSPLIAQQQIAALNIFAPGACSQVPSTRTWNCNLSVTNAETPRNPNIGISDVDPLLFRGPNRPDGFADVTPVGAAQLEVRAVAALLFGVPVTNGLYNALQTIQIDRGELPDTCAVGDYNNEACMPSLSKHQIATLISGQIQTWDEFKFRVGTQDVPMTQYPGIPALIAAQEAAIGKTFSNFVHYCRRVAGSGTGAQQYAKFLNNPCTAGALPPANDDNIFDGPRVLFNSGSGNVDICLDDFEKGKDTQSQTVAGETYKQNVDGIVGWALGTQSMEKNANAQLGYKFIKVDGVAPTLVNAHNGKYMDWVEPTYQWRKTGAGAPSGDTLALINRLVFVAGAPATVGSVLNVTSGYPFGKSGYLAVSSNGHAYSHILNESLPVIGYSHAPVGALNNCIVPVMKASSSNKPL